MKKLLLGLSIFLSVVVSSQTTNQYVCFSTGLNMRDKPSLTAKVISKIPYATKLSVNSAKRDTTPVAVENMVGYWTPVTYQGKTGYILDCYLINVVPPKKGTSDMLTYLKQISTPAGAPVIIKNGSMNLITENGYELKRQLYKNAAAWHHMTAYEYSADAYFLPDLTVQDAFLIVRQLKEFEEVFTEKNQLPIKNDSTESRVVKVETIPLGTHTWVTRIDIELTSGPFHRFVIELLDTGEVAIRQTFAV